jgi:hypothetical protein
MNTGKIKGQVSAVRAAGNQPVAGAVVLIAGDSPSHRDIAALTDLQGTYQFDDLAPGQYTLLVNAEGHPPQTGQVEVEADQVARLDILLPG